MRALLVIILLVAAVSVDAAPPKKHPAARKDAYLKLDSVSVEGGLAAGKARSAMEAGVGRLHGCVQASAPRTFRLVLRVRDGRVSSVEVIGLDEALSRCLRESARGLRFAGASGEATVKVTLKITNPDAARREVIAAARKAGLLGTLSSRGSIFGPSQKGDTFGGLVGNDVGGPGYGGLGKGGLSASGGALGIGGLGLGRGRSSGGYGGGMGRMRPGLDAKTRAKLLGGALRVPPLKDRPAPWVQPELRSWTFARPFDRVRLEGLGKEAAVVEATLSVWPAGKERESRRLFLLLHRQRGFLGTLSAPDNTRWIGLDGKDAIYAVTAGGELHRSELDAATRAGGFVRVNTISDALAWDAAGEIVVARRVSSIRVSRDGGKTFREVRPPVEGARLDDALVRDDGLLLVQTAARPPLTLISRDGGAHWERPQYQPGGVVRDGARLFASHGCGSAVLAADGKTWVAVDHIDRSRDGWEHLLDLGDRPRRMGLGDLHGQSEPPAPRPAKGAQPLRGGPTDCNGRGGVGGIGFSGADMYQRPCAGAGTWNSGHRALCLRGSIGTAPGDSSISLGWLGDGRAAHAREPARAPSLVLVDRRQGVLVTASLPEGCRASHVRSLRGTAVLFCEAGDKTQLYLADATGAWHDEGHLAAPADQLEWVLAADDGTLLVQSCQFSSERRAKEGSGYLCSTAFVRRPVALGQRAAWREALVHDALTYRPLDGGRILNVERRGDDLIGVSLDDGKRTRELCGRIEAKNDLLDLELEDGRLTFDIGEARHLLSRKGTLDRFSR